MSPNRDKLTNQHGKPLLDAEGHGIFCESCKRNFFTDGTKVWCGCPHFVIKAEKAI